MSDIVRLLLSDDPNDVAEGIVQAEHVMVSDAASRDFAAIRRTLISIVEAEPFNIHACSAVWALSKLYDPQLRQLFVMFLRRAVAHYHLNDVWQATCALSDCGDDSMQVVSGSVLDFEKNYTRAVDFLQREDAV